MKKKTAKPSKTDELLKKLGASLKESPLQARARALGEETDVAVAPVKKNIPVQTMANAWLHKPEEARGEGVLSASTPMSASVAHTNTVPMTGEGSNEDVASEKIRLEKVVMAAAQAVVRPAETLRERAMATGLMEAQKDLLQKPRPGAGEEAPSNLKKSADQDPHDDMREMALEEMKGVLQAMRSDDAAGAPRPNENKTTEKLEVPMNPEQVAQWKELQSVKAAIAELQSAQPQGHPRSALNANPAHREAVGDYAMGYTRPMRQEVFVRRPAAGKPRR